MKPFDRVSRGCTSAICVIALLATSLAHAYGQEASAKRALAHRDYDSWRSIQAPQISRDGKLVAYAFMAQDGDSEIVVRSLATNAEWRAPRGYRPPAPPPDDPGTSIGEVIAAQGRLVRPVITADSRFVVFSIEPLKAELNKAKKDKKKPEEMPKNAMGIMDISTGQVARIEKVKSFQVPEDGSGFIAYLLEPKPEPKPEPKKPDAASAAKEGATAAEASAPPKETSAGTAAAGGGGSSPTVREGSRTAGSQSAQTSARPPKKKEYGSDLVLRNMTSGAERTFSDVLDYTLSKDARTLAFAVSSKREETNGVYTVSPQADAAAAALLAGKGKYQKLTWDEDQTELAFISDKDDAEAKQPKFKVYLWSRGSAAVESQTKAGADRNHATTNPSSALEVVSTSSPGFRKDFIVSEKATLGFSLDGSRLFLGAAPPPDPEKTPDEELLADEKVLVDLWHWKDDYIQPMQRVRSEVDRNRSYRAVYLTKDKKFVQLADEAMESVSPSNDGRFAVGTDNRAYRVMADHDPGYSDFYLVNASDGSRKKIGSKQRGSVSLSASAKYAIFFDGKDWNSYSIADGRSVNLTKSLGVNFFNEENDTPSIPGSYGLAGWTKDDREVLIYDRYDIWQVSPDGSGAKNLTDGMGRREKTALRYVRLDPRERSIDPAKTLLLSANNQETMDSGFYRDKVNGGLPEKLIMTAKDFGNPTKARDAEVLMVTASRVDEFPDVWVTGPDFKDLKKVTNGDAQRAQFNWGKAELVSFKNADGVPLKGMLIKPENFDPTKKYPMIVYIYERLSQGLHGFRNPGPGTSINQIYYASNGYLVFMPDIVYTIGYPGESALKCVLPGIQAVVDKGYVNEQAIGIQGHSWGGYQIAYMVTQTNRFKAAAPGALVSNMTSAYSGIRWGTGLPRQFQYEHTQSRIGGSLWEYPMRYLENSPVFRADRVQTPLLMIHNDEDDAVPWYQGIEYFLALRRLNKEVYMFSYNGEKHGLRKRINQRDYTRRLQEFFDHFLKGAPKPEWMEKGIPYLQREKEKEKYRVTDEEDPGR